MKALVYNGPLQMRWEEWPEPQPGPGEVLVRVRAVGICGSDLRGYISESSHRVPPMVMGHEAAGEVVALGVDVPEEYLGMQVVIRPDLVCGSCEACLAGGVNHCSKRQLIGVHVQGAMAECVALPVENLLPLPERVSYKHGTLVEPLAVGLHAVLRADQIAGGSVLIAGSGPIGLLTLVAARELGARVVVTIDVIPKRLEAAAALGADAALNPTEPDWEEHLVETIGAESVDTAFDAVGIPATLGQCMQMVKTGGVVVAISGWRSIELQMNQLVRKEIDLRGTFNYNVEEFEQALQWLAAGRFDSDLLVTHTYPLHKGADTFAHMAKKNTEGIKFVLTQEALG
jgi:2-desacetyl-2-hydroxyethyl bacteriochlorophyllide A dehydrogenase